MAFCDLDSMHRGCPLATAPCEMSWPNGTFPPAETLVFSSIIGTHLPHEQEVTGITEQHINFEATLNQDDGMVNNLDVENSSSQTKKRKRWSGVWKEFTKIEIDGEEWAVCNHCKKKYPGSSKSGTTHLRNHLSRCPSKLRNLGGDAADKSPAKTGDCLTTTRGMKGKCKTDEESNQLDETRMIIKHWGASLVSMKDNILNVYKEEKQKLMSLFHRFPCSFNVSIEVHDNFAMSIFCISVHFIDDNWKLQKKVIHIFDGDAFEKVSVEKLECIVMEWNKDISSIVYSKCALESEEYELMKKWVREFRCSRPLAGIFLPFSWLGDRFRFFLQLSQHEVCRKMEKLEKYVSSNSNKFETAVDKAAAANSISMPIKLLSDHVDHLRHFELLEWGVGLKAVFWELDHIDPIGFKPINLTKEEWAIATEFHKFAKDLRDVANLVFDNCKYSTPNAYFRKIYRLYMIFLRWQESDMGSLRQVSEARKDFDEYWSNSKLILTITSILDPRFKMEIVRHWYLDIYGNDSGRQIKEIIDEVNNIYKEYARASESSKTPPMLDALGRPCTSSTQSELDRYLRDSIHPFLEDFDILDWWRCNSPVYPTLARMARDYLAIPIGAETELDYSLENEIRNIIRGEGVDDDIKEALIHTKAWL